MAQTIIGLLSCVNTNIKVLKESFKEVEKKREENKKQSTKLWYYTEATASVLHWGQLTPMTPPGYAPASEPAKR